MPRSLNSSAIASVRRATPDFDAAYAPMPRPAWLAALAPMLTMRPLPRASRCGNAACDASSAVRTLIANRRSQVSTLPASTVS